VTLDVSHFERSEVKALAFENNPVMFVTFEVFHSLKSPLNDGAFAN